MIVNDDCDDGDDEYDDQYVYMHRSMREMIKSRPFKDLCDSHYLLIPGEAAA